MESKVPPGVTGEGPIHGLIGPYSVSLVGDAEGNPVGGYGWRTIEKPGNFRPVRINCRDNPGPKSMRRNCLAGYDEQGHKVAYANSGCKDVWWDERGVQRGGSKQNTGCRFNFQFGINTDVGIYYNFTVDANGTKGGCPAIEAPIPCHECGSPIINSCPKSTLAPDGEQLKDLVEN